MAARGVEEHHLTSLPTPSSSSSCIANLNGLLSNPINLTVRESMFLLSLSLSLSLFHLLLSHHNLHHDSASIMFHIIFSHPHSPLVIQIDEYVISSKHLVIPVFPYYLVVAYNMIHHFPSILMLYIEISRGLIRNWQSFKCTSYIAKSSLDNVSTTIMYIRSPPLSCSSSSSTSLFSVLSFSSHHSSCSRAGHAIRQRSRWPQTPPSNSKRTTP